jgi:hypothetical protein
MVYKRIVPGPRNDTKLVGSTPQMGAVWAPALAVPYATACWRRPFDLGRASARLTA